MRDVEIDVSMPFLHTKDLISLKVTFRRDYWRTSTLLPDWTRLYLLRLGVPHYFAIDVGAAELQAIADLVAKKVREFLKDVRNQRTSDRQVEQPLPRTGLHRYLPRHPERLQKVALRV
jgi:hypothetical protein